MRTKERILSNALAAVICEKGVEVVVRDETGNFVFHFEEETSTLRMEMLDPDDPLMRATVGGVLVVDTKPPEDANRIN